VLKNKPIIKIIKQAVYLQFQQHAALDSRHWVVICSATVAAKLEASNSRSSDLQHHIATATALQSRPVFHCIESVGHSLQNTRLYFLLIFVYYNIFNTT